MLWRPKSTHHCDISGQERLTQRATQDEGNDIFKTQIPLFYNWSLSVIVLARAPNIALNTFIVKTVDTYAPLETALQQAPVVPRKYKLSTWE